MAEVIRRNRPGTRLEDMYKWERQEINEMDSPIAVQQYIEQLEREDMSDIERILTCPKDQDIAVWQYDHMRIFVSRLNGLLTVLDTVCTAETCSEMSAGGQQYLCAAHGKEAKNCPAMDYCIHTLDQTCAVLNNPKIFSSRINISKESISRHVQSSARRLYRIFAHAYFHHRQEFDKFERDTHLTERFVHFCSKFRLITPSLMNIPDGYEQH